MGVPSFSKQTLVQHFMSNNERNKPRQLSSPQQPTSVYYGKIPFIPEITPKLTRVLKRDNIRFGYYNLITNNSFFSSMKDKVPVMFRSNVVYLIPCNNCNHVYIGNTSTWLKTRLTIYKSDIKTKKTRCALAEHMTRLQHEPEFERSY